MQALKLFDTHCHFERADAEEIAAILKRAKAVGVEKLMAIGGSPALNEAAALAVKVAADPGLAAECPKVICALGHDRDQVASVRQTQAPQPRAAIGEIGLDYHYSIETREAQLRLFGEQLEEARQCDLPVVIHTREAAEDTLALLREIPSRGIIHCFTGSPEEAKAYLELGFYISISGIVTFRAADNVRSSALVVPDERILIETDAPFLAPVPMRGKSNEPAFIRYTCEFLAELRGSTSEDFAALTFRNAERVLERT